VEKASVLYKSKLSQQREDKPISQELLQTKWMIEELRISLFSQNLGTAQPISLKRIINHLKGFS
jgi:ATP-dependent helicase HrpA